jgi:hypothetical protein
MAKREFLLATALSTIWASMCFLGFGILYAAVPRVVGWASFNRFENMLGHPELPAGATIPWVSLLVFGLAMVFATAPVNYYWSNRLRHRTHRE